MTADRIEPIDHGGDLDAARRRFPAAPEPWIDLSTGVNPHAYAFALPDLGVWQRLPQAAAERGLLEAAARRYGAASADAVVVAPGSQALIQVVPRLVDSAEVAVLAPTYAEHAVAWARCGHRVSERQELADVGDARVVVVVNPNNPTGRIIAGAGLRGLAADLERRRGLLVVDEAFADFVPEVSLVPDLPHNAVVLRSFGKAYGLAGLRLGFAVAHVSMARRLRAEFGPWAVSGPALAIGATALSDGDWLAEARDQLAADCRRLDALLAASGFMQQGGTLLFRLVQHVRAREIADSLGRHGILVRRFSAHPLWLRFGVPGSEPAWERLARALIEAAARG